MSIPAIVSVHGQRRHRIDEHPPRADLAGFGEQQAVGLLQLLLQHGAGGEDDLDFPFVARAREVPPEMRGVAHDLEGRHLEEHDQPGLVKFRGAAVNELESERRFPAPAGPSTTMTLPRGIRLPEWDRAL